MTATLQDIQNWLKYAKEEGASHLIVAVDRFNFENYPVYISHDQKIEKEIKRIENQDLQGIDEIYNMSIDIDKQLAFCGKVYNI